MDKTAIFIDGAFFVRRATRIFGSLAPADLAWKVWEYALLHIQSFELNQLDPIHRKAYAANHIYRIFFYDCPPLDKRLHHPVTGQSINFATSDRAKWRLAFHDALRSTYKVALRLGEVDNTNATWSIHAGKIKDLYMKKCTIDDLVEQDYFVDVKQKGVDMRIGLDIASVAYKKQASRIVLITGDSDFVPAAKLARREGVEFVLDSMHAHVKADLTEHVDYKVTVFPAPPKKEV